VNYAFKWIYIDNLYKQLKDQDETVNVLCLGFTGSGKSTFINCIANQEIARTSNQFTSCTSEYADYLVPFLGRYNQVNIIDSVGWKDNSGQDEISIENYVKMFDAINRCNVCRSKCNQAKKEL